MAVHDGLQERTEVSALVAKRAWRHPFWGVAGDERYENRVTGTRPVLRADQPMIKPGNIKNGTRKNVVIFFRYHVLYAVVTQECGQHCDRESKARFHSKPKLAKRLAVPG